jgi:hypothetical protein
MRGKGCTLPNSVDGVTGDSNIAELFAGKFKNIFNSVVSDEADMGKAYKQIMNRLPDAIEPVCMMSDSDLHEIVKNIKHGKSDGNLGLFSDHILHGSPMLFELLTALFNSMIIHGVTPSNMLVGTMIPIPKHRRLSISRSDNFRGIFLQSVLCKLMEMFFFVKGTSNLQFGFKTKLSAAMATLVITETVDYYLSKNGSVYALALDATKAFDRVQFSRLFDILLEQNMNPLFIQLLYNMYADQQVRVKFKDSETQYFHISNRVKQGGVLSPTLFSCYVDGMLQRLQNSGSGCYVGNHFTGCVAYADDLIFLAPTQYSLKNMIFVCEDFADQHSIKFNRRNRNLMLFSRRTCLPVNINACGEPVEFVS